MICLTGDVHHMSMRNPDQSGLRSTEARCAQKYVEIAEANNLKVSLFITGRCFVEEWSDLEGICKSPSVEVGGHNYAAFQPHLFYALSGRILGLKNGPRAWQRYEARRTLETIKQYTGKSPVIWRDHAYRRDANTYPVLEEFGIRFISDEVNYNGGSPRLIGKRLISVPINVPVDHDHLCLRKRGGPSMGLQEWYCCVCKAVERHLQYGRTATLLIHPICMETADQMERFKRLAQFLGQFHSLFMSEINSAQTTEIV